MSDEPTYDAMAEQAVLGTMMASPEAIADAEAILGTGEGFYRPAHTTIYRALVELRDKQAPTDPVALISHLPPDVLSRAGGPAYISTCYATPATPAQTGYYARIVADHARLRALATVSSRITHLATTAAAGEAEQAVEKARQLLADMDTGPAPLSLRQWGETTPGLLEHIEQAAQGAGTDGVPTGLYDLDDLLGGGLRPGQLIIVGARPSVGKSLLLMQMGSYAAIRGKLRVALFSLEMSEQEIGLRIVSSGAQVPLDSLIKGDLTDQQWTRLARFVGETDHAPLFIDDTARATLAHIRTGITALQRAHGGVDLVLVDYLQLVDQPGTGRESRQEQVAAFSRGLKLLAKEHNLPIVAASQLNRGPEGRSDKRPSLSDLRESGALEQDADVVILLHREDAYDPESPRAGEVDLIVPKQRQGRTDTITAAARFHICRFESLAQV